MSTPPKCSVSNCPHDGVVLLTFGRMIVHPYCPRHAQPHIESNKRSN